MTSYRGLISSVPLTKENFNELIKLNSAKINFDKNLDIYLRYSDNFEIGSRGFFIEMRHTPVPPDVFALISYSNGEILTVKYFKSLEKIKLWLMIKLKESERKRNV